MTSADWQEAILEVYRGSTIGFSHYFLYANMFIQELLERNNGDEEKEEEPPLVGSLRVVGVGYGRTGTYSLMLALNELGIPTLHTMHLYENQNIMDMWVDKIVKPSLENKHVELGQPDFDVITRNGYQGTTDFPVALYFEQVHAKYPDCKFILTTRENSEVWFRSWDTLTKSITDIANVAGKFITFVNNYSLYLRWLFAVVNEDDTFLTSAEPQMTQNKDRAIASYERHNARVREFIPASQLLEYNVRQGWRPLCNFLEISEEDCPVNRPFPKTNSARSVQSQVLSVAMMPFLCAAVCAIALMQIRQKKATSPPGFPSKEHAA